MDSQTCRRRVVVNIANGLHMGPSLQISQVAQGFNCDIQIRKADHSANAKSIMDILTLIAEFGTELTLEANGENAKEAVDSIGRLFDQNFETENSEPN